jgi:hypothetical protein
LDDAVVGTRPLHANSMRANHAVFDPIFIQCIIITASVGLQAAAGAVTVDLK